MLYSNRQIEAEFANDKDDISNGEIMMKIIVIEIPILEFDRNRNFLFQLHSHR